MLKVLRIIIISIPVLWNNCLSQSVSHQVLVPWAGVEHSGNIYFSQTVGETMVEYTGCSFYLLTQGFQQPSVKIFNTDVDDNIVRAYPNPVSDFVTIEMIGDKARTFRIEFMDLTGRTFISVKKTFGENYMYREQYNVKEMVSGLYMIRIMSTDGLFNRTFRKQKI